MMSSFKVATATVSEAYQEVSTSFMIAYKNRKELEGLVWPKLEGRKLGQ